jgi:hypothetical protein
VGLEAVEDLIADLEDGLARLGAALAAEGARGDHGECLARPGAGSHIEQRAAVD